jgi:hypothetical protein
MIRRIDGFTTSEFFQRVFCDTFLLPTPLGQRLSHVMYSDRHNASLLLLLATTMTTMSMPSDNPPAHDALSDYEPIKGDTL